MAQISLARGASAPGTTDFRTASQLAVRAPNGGGQPCHAPVPACFALPWPRSASAAPAWPPRGGDPRDRVASATRRALRALDRDPSRRVARYSAVLTEAKQLDVARRARPARARQRRRRRVRRRGRSRCASGSRRSARRAREPDFGLAGGVSQCDPGHDRGLRVGRRPDREHRHGFYGAYQFDTGTWGASAAPATPPRRPRPSRTTAPRSSTAGPAQARGPSAASNTERSARLLGFASGGGRVRCRYRLGGARSQAEAQPADGSRWA